MPTPPNIRARLRDIRTQQGLTLKQVEIKSRGAWKAVVVGSYERGTRSLSFDRAAALCEFYGVPLSALLMDKDENFSLDQRRIINLVAVDELARKRDRLAEILRVFTQSITHKRRDWNGQILSLRRGDIESLELMTGLDYQSLLKALENRALLVRAPDLP